MYEDSDDFRASGKRGLRPTMSIVDFPWRSSYRDGYLKPYGDTAFLHWHTMLLGDGRGCLDTELLLRPLTSMGNRVV